MSLFGQMGISASGMAAERLRMQVIAENLANANSTRGADGQPYRRKSVSLQEASGAGPSFGEVLGGVEATGIVQDPRPGRRVYDPANPDADAQGYVTLPNVDTVTEMVDLITAQRGYDANVQALNAAKQMFTRALDLLR
jgi:flagellar basal-body rod protein FlgC